MFLSAILSPKSSPKNKQPNTKQMFDKKALKNSHTVRSKSQLDPQTTPEAASNNGLNEDPDAP